ncbi:MAG TPA: ATP-binding protein [Candidatus Limnocylindria bacterium]|nr:ATP-binding protein [Candidatus Limnocylindria bacterium]
MTDGAASARASARRAADVALVILALVLSVFTVVVVSVAGAAPAVVNDRSDTAIVTAATLVSLAVAAVAWQRGRVSHDPSALLRASAFAVLALLNGLTLLIGLTGADASLGATLNDPGQLPLVAAIVARSVAALLLVAAGWVALSRGVPSLSAPAVLLGPFTLVAALLVVAALAQDSLPAVAPPEALAMLAADPTMTLPFGSAPILAIIQTAIGIGFLIAAVLAHRAFRRSGRAGDALLAAGLLIAAASQVHSAIHPGSYSSVVTTGDLLRLGFYAVLLAGVVAESRDDLADLRAATMEVRRLAEAEFAAAALEERARLAREIHDGLAQELWYAKLKQSRLAQIADFSDEPRELSQEVEAAIDMALAEARHAVAAMRGGAESGPLLEMLRRQVEDFSDRFAIRAELVREGTADPEIGPRAHAELIRIVQEALTNVRKHADATVVRVLVATDDELRITISDNGRGFRPDAAPAGFGLESMRQRAAVIGARLSVTSAPHDGSRVELVMPLGSREGTRAS